MSLETKVYTDPECYTHEGGKIITWTDELLENKRYALSFEDAAEASLVFFRLTSAATHQQISQQQHEGGSDVVFNPSSHSQSNGLNALQSDYQRLRLMFKGLSAEEQSSIRELLTVFYIEPDRPEHVAKNLTSHLEDIYVAIKNIFSQVASISSRNAVVEILISGFSYVLVEDSNQERRPEQEENETTKLRRRSVIFSLMNLLEDLEARKKLFKLGTLCKIIKVLSL